MRVETRDYINFSREDFDNPLVEIRTSAGSLILELFPDEAPLAVANFIGLAEGTLAWTDPETGEQTERHRIEDEHWVELIPGTPAVQDGRLVTVEDRGAARRLCIDGAMDVPQP